jgi:hypothetical protein
MEKVIWKGWAIIKETLNKLKLLFTALLVLQGCNISSKKVKPIYLNFKLTKVESFSVNDDLTSLSVNHQPIGSNFIYFIDQRTKTLIKVDALNAKIEKVCYLPAFTASDRFSVNETKKEIYLTNDENIKTFSFNGLSKGSFKFDYYNGFVVQISNNNIPIKRNEKIYGHFLIDDENTYKSTTFFEQPIQIEINLNTRKANFSSVHYPLSYRLNCYGLNFAPERLELSENEQLFTFAYSDTAYVYDENLKESKPYYLGSYKKHSFDYIDFKDVKKINENAFTEFYYQTERYAFTKIAPLSGLIKRSQLKQDKKSGRIIENLVLYDTNFNYVGESKKEFKSFVLIDTKKGLYNLKLNLKTKCLEIYRLSW